MILQSSICRISLFKIQYGEIYRMNRIADTIYKKLFKIQYGEIYRNESHIIYVSLTKFKIQYGEIYSFDYLFE